MSNSTSTPNNYSYFTDPAYQVDIRYTIWTQIYYIGVGFLATFLNLYLVFLFVKYPKLRDIPCNWIIIQQCLSEVLMGYGTVMRAVTFLFATNLTIINFDLSFCFWVGGLCSAGYRIGQTIALLMAVDRLLAIWKPGFYAKRHANNVIVINALITTVVLFAIIFMYLYGIINDQKGKPLSLYYCLYFTGSLYSQVIPSYSTTVTIVFFVDITFKTSDALAAIETFRDAATPFQPLHHASSSSYGSSSASSCQHLARHQFH
uniref:G-protein coupled receptors family 1 profile domain-containing protein n=1 Tax=Acrobeloides nanus TaxID=290746 RepID=A0A914E5Z5_9BILA